MELEVSSSEDSYGEEEETKDEANFEIESVDELSGTMSEARISILAITNVSELGSKLIWLILAYVIHGV